MLRKVAASKRPEQMATAVVNTVLQRGRDKARCVRACADVCARLQTVSLAAALAH
jgi:hypothetical protein